MADTRGQIPLFDMSPGELPAIGNDLTQEQRDERERLLASVAESRLGSMQQRLAYLLCHFPETRDSDVALAIRYWRMFQPDILEKWNPIELEVLFPLDRIDTISRMRRHIQNVLKLYRSTLEVRRQREELELEMQQIIAADRLGLSEVRFYLDETSGADKFNGIGGVCVMNWKQYEKYWSSLTQWRRGFGWPGNIHFAETGTAGLPRAMALLHQLEQRRGGLLFLGYALQSKGLLHQTRLSLFIQLVVDSLRVMDQSGCLGERRSVLLIKEEETGFDQLHLADLRTHLERQLVEAFPHRVYLDDVITAPKGRDVMLESADLIASSMMRWHLFGGIHPKDELARAVFRVSGLDEPRDRGTVFKVHPA